MASEFQTESQQTNVTHITCVKEQATSGDNTRKTYFNSGGNWFESRPEY